MVLEKFYPTRQPRTSLVHRQLNLSSKNNEVVVLLADACNWWKIQFTHQYESYNMKFSYVIWVHPRSMIHSPWITFSLSILKIGTDFRPLNLNGKRYAVVNSIIKTCFAGLSSSHFSSRVRFLLIHSLLVGSNFYPDKNWNMKISAIWLNNLNLHQI